MTAIEVSSSADESRHLLEDIRINLFSSEPRSREILRLTRILGLFAATTLALQFSIGHLKGRSYLNFRTQVRPLGPLALDFVSSPASLLDGIIMADEDTHGATPLTGDEVALTKAGLEVVGVGGGAVKVVHERCFWHSCGDNTVCRLSKDDSSVDGDSTVEVSNASSISDCRHLCEEKGEQQCTGVEYNSFDGRCELWRLPILSHRSCVTGNDCAETNYSCHTVQCEAIDTAVKLSADERSFKDEFGSSVDISVDTVIVGAAGDNDRGFFAGAAYVFVRDANTIVEQAKLTASDGYRDARFGNSVSVSGDIALVGAHRDRSKGENSGAAYVFRRSDNVWREEAKLTADDGFQDQQFGWSVSVFGQRALIGTLADPTKNLTGEAYIFEKTNQGWVQQGKLTPVDGSPWRKFGSSVSLAENLALIGAPGKDPNDEHSAGAAYIFIWQNETWSQQKLLVPDLSPGAQFGHSVSVSSDTCLIGAHKHNGKGDASGAAYIFIQNDHGVWVLHQQLLADDSDANDGFGHSVGISRSTAVVGAYADESNGIDRSGSGYIFVLAGTSWVQQARLSPEKVLADAQFGFTTSISGHMAVVSSSQSEAFVFPAALTQACPGLPTTAQ